MRIIAETGVQLVSFVILVMAYESHRFEKLLEAERKPYDFHPANRRIIEMVKRQR